MYKMDTLAYETLFNTMLNLPAIDILNNCVINTTFRQICNDNYFWRQKYYVDYGEIITPFGLSYRDLYLNIVDDKIRQFPVYTNNILSSHIWLLVNQSVGYLLNTLLPQDNTTLGLSLHDENFNIITTIISEKRPSRDNTSISQYWDRLSAINIINSPLVDITDESEYFQPITRLLPMFSSEQNFDIDDSDLYAE